MFTSYSQCGEDLIMLFLLRNILGMSSLTYLDVGANDARHLNNTMLFYEMGARGVSVDANEAFKASFDQHRPEDMFLACGVGELDGSAPFYMMEAHTLSTFSAEAAREYVTACGHQIVDVVERPIYRLETILANCFEAPPDLLCLDVEGMDELLLRSIDFSRWRPAVICVETIEYSLDGSGRKLTEITDYLVDSGYRLFADTFINSIYVSEAAWATRGQAAA